MDGIKKFNEIVATCILAVIIIFAIVLVGHFACNRNAIETPQPITIECVIQTDSTGVVAPEARQVAESIQTYIDKHEHLLDDKYRHILEQKENIQDYLTWGGILVTLVLSIFGFFGYKSLSSIEERITNAVELKASQKASDSAEKRVEEYEKQADKKITETEKINEGKLDNYKESTRNELSLSITERLNKTKVEIRKYIQKEAEDAVRDAYNKSLSEKVNDVETNTKTIEALQEEITSLTRQIDDLKGRLAIVEAKKAIPQSTKSRPSLNPSTPERHRRERTNPNPFKK